MTARKASMSKVPSVVESAGGRADKWFPWIGQLRESAPAIPHAAKASVTRLAAIKAKLDAYERSYLLNLQQTTAADQSR